VASTLPRTRTESGGKGRAQELTSGLGVDENHHKLQLGVDTDSGNFGTISWPPDASGATGRRELERVVDAGRCASARESGKVVLAGPVAPPAAE
jgi:hypothetical protein